MTIKTKIKNELLNDNLLNNDNHVTFKYFQLYLEGNYNNEQEYYNNIEYIQLNKNNHKKMLSFVINKFTNFMSIDFNCSYSYIQKTIVSLFNTEELKQLNNKLIDIAKYIIQDIDNNN